MLGVIRLESHSVSAKERCPPTAPGGGGGRLPYKSDGGARGFSESDP